MRTVFPTKEQDETSEINLNEMEINDLPHNKFKKQRDAHQTQETKNKQRGNFKERENIRY